jgi:hypothetical protein
MNIEFVITDRHGANLEIGDCIEIFNWGKEGESLGQAQLIWDEDEGRVSTTPCIIDDAYDFWKKAIPNCKKL